MTKIYLALGSNLGDRQQFIEKAIEQLRQGVRDVTVAAFYETKPQYFEQQDLFLNTALSGNTDLTPKKLLVFIKEIEKKTGRKIRFKYGPREVDIDILFYNNLIFKDKSLIIPHPLLHEREFVLRPLLDLNPDFVHPVLKKTMRELFEELKLK